MKTCASTIAHREVDAPLRISILDRMVPAVVVLRGEIIAASAPRLRAVLFSLTARDDPAILIDLTKVSFVDATGLGVLAAAESRARADGGQVVLVNPTPAVAVGMELVGMPDMIWNRPTT